MKICKTEQEYIDAIAPVVQKACKRYGYLPSVLIAQSCLENGYSIPSYFDNPQIALLVKYNNMVGIKSSLLSDSWADKTVWPGKSLTKKTPEVYGGKPVIITDNFRIYDDIEQSFADFLLFMKYGAYTKGGKPKYGDAILNMKDPDKLIQKVNALGYATGPTYATNVMKIVNKHNLTKYDNLDGVEPTIYTPGYRKTAIAEKIPIGEWKIKQSPEYNQQVPSRGNGKKYIAVHYLGVDGQNNGLWDGGYGAHYVVYWDGTIYKVCDHDAITWQVGTSNGEYVQKHPYARNNNCIGIEMCCHNTDGYCPETPTGEKHWYFTEATQRAAAWLVRKLMKDLNLDISHVLRHFDVVNKNCPAPYVYNNRYKGTWTWDEFLDAVKTGYCPDGSTPTPAPTPTPTPTPPSTILRRGDRGDAVKTMQTMLIKCGYSCGKAGADGIFGGGTENAVIAFQKAAKLSVDGLYGPKTRAALEAAYKAKTAPAAKPAAAAPKKAAKWAAHKVMTFVMQYVADLARTSKWKYGDSHTLPPCKDGKISCDRLIALALWLMGFHDQREGGEVCSTLGSYLTKRGWKKVSRKSDIKPGAVVAVKDKNHSWIDHVFYVVDYDPKTDLCTKFDEGSDERIQTKQPFKNKKLVEWPNKEFVCAWNVPARIGSGTPGKYIKDGVDYSPAFNAIYYYKMNPDLYKAYGSDKAKLFDHFCKNGMREGRQAVANFNPNAYRDRYADLKKAFGSDMRRYYEHWCTHGREEGRIGI